MPLSSNAVAASACFYVVSVTFSPDGRQVVTTSSDGKFRLWDVLSGEHIGAPLPGSDSFGWGTYFPDGRRVSAVFADGTGLIWSVDPNAWNAHACRVAHRTLTHAEWHDFLPERRYRSSAHKVARSLRRQSPGARSLSCCSHSDLSSAYSTSPCSSPSIRSGHGW